MSKFILLIFIQKNFIKDCTFAKRISIRTVVQFDSKKDTLENSYMAYNKCIKI